MHWLGGERHRSTAAAWFDRQRHNQERPRRPRLPCNVVPPGDKSTTRQSTDFALKIGLELSRHSIRQSQTWEAIDPERLKAAEGYEGSPHPANTGEEPPETDDPSG